MSAVNETLIRDVVAEVLGQTGRHRHCNRKTGVRACARAEIGFLRLQREEIFRQSRVARQVWRVSPRRTKPAPPRRKRFCSSSKKASPPAARSKKSSRRWRKRTPSRGARLNLKKPRSAGSTTKSPSCRSIKLVPGVDWLRPDARSGDHGITLEEYTPFGVVGAITPSTHSIPTLSGNIVNICAAGNAVVFNAHPSAARCAAVAVRAYNEAIYRETGIENIACIIEKPTLDSFNALCKNELIRLLLVTGGPMVVKAAMQIRQARHLRRSRQSARVC